VVATLAQLAPLAIGGAFVPTWTTHVILLIATTNRPVANSLSFVFGNFTYRMMLGIAVLFFLSSSEAVRRVIDRAETLPPSMRTIAGFGLVTAGALLFITRPRAEQKEPPWWLRAVESVPPWLAFAWGFTNVAMPGFQYVYFLGGLAVIYKSGLPPVSQLILLIIFSAFLQLMLLTPIALYVAFRSRADPMLGSLREWLARWGNVLIGGILLFFGAVFVLQGFGVL